jgi:hypothetical protein
MAGKPSHDATKNLRPDEPTQVTDKGLKIGLPIRGSIFAALKKVAKADKP